MDKITGVCEEMIYYLEESLVKYNEVIIFGAGSSGQQMKVYLDKQHISIKNFCDNDIKKHGTYVCGIEVISPSELKDYLDEKVGLIISSQWSAEICEQLKSMGIHNFLCLNFEPTILNNLDKIEQVHRLLQDETSKRTYKSMIKYWLTQNPDNLYLSTYEQYLHPIVHPKIGDTIIDGGAFIGDTVKIFTEYLDNQCKLISFEPSKDNFSKLKQYIFVNHLEDKVIPFNYGLMNEKKDLFLSLDTPNNPAGYWVVEQKISEKSEAIKVISIDEIVHTQNIDRVDLIKLDIEGSELSALKGAVQTIREFRPRLQVCIYHKREDVFEIPLFIHEVFKEIGYQFYVGHHYYGPWETVLYAEPSL